MTQEQDRAETVSLLQDLGLKEYEARCFLALTQLSSATAKEISDVSEVPRTRVYDAVRVLEAQGLVEVQHSSPQKFRAVSVDEATQTLRQKFDSRIETLGTYLEDLDLGAETDDTDGLQEVWSLTGTSGIQSRMLELVDDAESELVLVVVDGSILTGELLDALHEAAARGVTIMVGSQSEPIVSDIESELPEVEVFETELEWLVSSSDDEEVAISRLVLTDRTALLVSSYHPEDGYEEPDEQAIFATGLGNGVVVLIRRLITTGLLPETDPGR